MKIFLICILALAGASALAQTDSPEVSAASGRFMEESSPIRSVDGSRLLLQNGTRAKIPDGAILDTAPIPVGQNVTVQGPGADLAGGRFIEAFDVLGPDHRSLLHPKADPHSPWLVKSGKIMAPLLTREGWIDGVVLSDDTAIRFPAVPPAPSGAIAERREVRAIGTVIGGQLYASSIFFPQLNLVYDSKWPSVPKQAAGIAGPTVTITYPGPTTPRPAPAKGSFSDLRPMRDISRVETVLYDPQGEIDTLLLSDGAVVKIPPEARLGLPADLKKGQEVSLVGRGEKFPQGTSIIADWAQTVESQTLWPAL